MKNGTIIAVNLAQRKTLIKRSEIDKLLEQPEPVKYDISECYNPKEIHEKYGISESAIQKLIKRHNIPKIKKGWYAYVPKTIIDNLLS